jgi:hypothetical protein
LERVEMGLKTTSSLKTKKAKKKDGACGNPSSCRSGSSVNGFAFVFVYICWLSAS